MGRSLVFISDTWYSSALKALAEQFDGKVYVWSLFNYLNRRDSRGYVPNGLFEFGIEEMQKLGYILMHHVDIVLLDAGRAVVLRDRLAEEALIEGQQIDGT